MEMKLAQDWMTNSLRNVDPAYVWDRRHIFHPTNRALTLELAALLFGIVADLVAYGIDGSALLLILQQAIVA